MWNLAAQTGQLQRHPKDQWEMAEPYPMSHRSRRALRSLIRAIAPPDPALSNLEDLIEDHTRRMMQYMHPMVARGFLLSIHLLNWSPVLLLRNSRTLVNLTRDQAEAALECVGNSRFPSVQMILMGLRSLVLSTYFDQEEVHKAIHYQPAPFMAERISLRKRLLKSKKVTQAKSLAAVIGAHA